MKTPIKIGYSLSLTGALASNGQTARLAHQLWLEAINEKGGLLGRPVELVCVDDQTDPKLIPAIYEKLLDEDKVDLVIGGYGDNSIMPAMPLIMERKKFLIGLMGLAANLKFNYSDYFVMIPTGPQPNLALTQGFFDIAASLSPQPKTVAILVADALFAQSPALGAKAHALRLGLEVIYDNKYPLATTDFSPYVKELEAAAPDIVFLCSYLNDSVGLITTINGSNLNPVIVGGAMIGPQNGSVKARLGALLNGIVNYEYWLPVPQMLSNGVEDMISNYQEKAESSAADPLGYYVAPQAYAQLQVLAQAVTATASLDDALLAEYTRTAVFNTVVGDVQFGRGGGWAEPRVLQVQYQKIDGNEVNQFKEQDKQVVVSPAAFASGTLIYPYKKAKA